MAQQAAPAARPRSRRGARLAPWVVLLFLAGSVAVLAGGVVAFYAASRQAYFQSRVTLLIDQEPAAFQSVEPGLLDKLSRLRSKYVGLVGTEAFAEPVAEQARLPVAEVLGGLKASANPNTLLLVITATMPNAIEAHRIAQLAGDELVSYVESEQFDAKIPSQDQVTFSVVSPATPPHQTEPAKKKIALEGGVTFAVVAAAGIVGADLLRRRRR